MIADAVEIDELVVAEGEMRVVDRTVRTAGVRIAAGGELTAPPGRALVMTVDGVETGSAKASPRDTATRLAPGRYRGDIVVAVVDDVTDEAFGQTFHLRQAAFVVDGQPDPARSAPSALVGGTLEPGVACDVRLRSVGEAFGGFAVHRGEYRLERPRIDLDGNGRLDFVGVGAAVLANGADTRVVVEGADISTRGSVRTAVVATGGAGVVVKDSTIRTRDGVLPSDFVPGLGPDMMTAPWMLGVQGNVCATLLLGDDTRATYVGSRISSESWGVLASDTIMTIQTGRTAYLTAIDCDLAITGTDGYGIYSDKNVIARMLGVDIRGVTLGGVLSGGALVFDDSNPLEVAALDEQLELGLSMAELSGLPVRACVVESGRFGFLVHQWEGSSIDVRGGTRIGSRDTMFTVKSSNLSVTVDGSSGARITADNGILFQQMDTDDAVLTTGDFINVGDVVYHEPTEPVVVDDGRDLTAVRPTDSSVVFTDVELTGDLYNGAREPRNLVLRLERSRLSGVVSASTTRHRVSSIDITAYREVNEVVNTVAPAVNKGVIVTVGNGSHWVVTGTCHLTALSIAADATVTAGSLTVDGVETPLASGSSYLGEITLTQP